MARSKKTDDVVETQVETSNVDYDYDHLVSELRDVRKYSEAVTLSLKSKTDECESLKAELARKNRDSDESVTVDGKKYRVVYKHVTKEFFEDIKRRIVPEEALCLALLPL